MAANPDLVVLGAGPAGLAAAYRAARSGLSVTVLERAETVGGMAASFEVGGMRVDYGSHRLNPDMPPELLADLRALLGADLQNRHRTGRLLLGDRWVAYPFKPRELARVLPAGPLARAALDVFAARRRTSAQSEAENYAQVMRAGFGETLYDLVYEPFARKLWGVSGDELDAGQARRKAGAPTAWTAMVRSVRSALSTESFDYLYPRRGFGQLCDTLADAAVDAGARLRLGAAVEGLEPDEQGVTITASRSEQHSLSPQSGAGSWAAGGRLRAGHVFSTLPLPLLARITTPAPDYAVLEAASALEFRALLLVYAVHEGGRWSRHDVHYLPTPDTPITRISEPANHRINPEDPADQSVVCFEIPCAIGDEVWSADEQRIAELLQETVERCRLPALRPSWIQVKRLRHGYPVHHTGYREHLADLDAWAEGLPHLTTLGRQGLFTPDNVHHSMAMGYEAAHALGAGTFDRERWQRARAGFATHAIET